MTRDPTLMSSCSRELVGMAEPIAQLGSHVFESVDGSFGDAHVIRAVAVGGEISVKQCVLQVLKKLAEGFQIHHHGAFHGVATGWMSLATSSRAATLSVAPNQHSSINWAIVFEPRRSARTAILVKTIVDDAFSLAENVWAMRIDALSILTVRNDQLRPASIPRSAQAHKVVVHSSSKTPGLE
ncbi:hypothetical protein H257_08163 [Aphanomyces astaci]|uniref:Uncharacterized protein n=1 Tax=Aphanomyces astaci TaxID=112090 RepID=W4GE00_APHAT|nr:hypothetical protein H257_08163 [Aphanomyces astaci]ETV77917.1 hypothetical protein H257_08163 [Aphanomyces astaci]|eukprot:XP_009832254.1 hypothetical protein H257_08163 [Aphanomyces astaci]